MAQCRIWWQSSTNIDGFPDYKSAIETHAAQYLGPETELEVHGVPFGTTSIDYLAFAALNEHEIIHTMLNLRETGGFDAVALGCFHDPAMNAIRELLGIPVLGMAETAMMWAMMYSRKPAVVFNNVNAAEKTIVHVVEDYHMENRMAAPRYFELEVEKLAVAFEDPEPAIDKFLAAAREAIDDGADMIVPGCGILNLVMAQNKITRVPGTDVPIMDVTAALMTTCQAAATMHRINDFGVSRKDYYRTPPDTMIEAVQNIYFPLNAQASH